MSAQTETQETEAATDGPLLDLTDAGVKKFIKQAKARGYVTMEELNKVLPSEEVTPDAIEDTLAMLSEMGVNVVEADEDVPHGGVLVYEVDHAGQGRDVTGRRTAVADVAAGQHEDGGRGSGQAGTAGEHQIDSHGPR